MRNTHSFSLGEKARDDKFKFKFKFKFSPLFFSLFSLPLLIFFPNSTARKFAFLVIEGWLADQRWLAVEVAIGYSWVCGGKATAVV